MTLTSEYIDDRILRVRFGDCILFDYCYRSDADSLHCPRPFMHPIRTLAGDILSNYRPIDHPWHAGLSMTANNVNGMNFWGGGTYRRETGQYTQVSNVGKQIHRAWTPSENDQSWIEVLDWVGPNEEPVFTETRTLSVIDIDPEIGLWRLIWESSLKNTLGEKLSINSYCSGEGLEGSGYTGLFLRMSRGFDTVPQIFVPKDGSKWTDYHDGETRIDRDKINAWKSKRLAYQGVFDTSLNGGLLLCEDLTENPPYELHWFYRGDAPYLAWSTAFHKTLFVEADTCITFRHSLTIVNGFWTQERANTLWLKP